jgi:glutamine cyclotransferase
VEAREGSAEVTRRAALILAAVAIVAIVAVAAADTGNSPSSSPVGAVKEFVIDSSLDDNGYSACKYLTIAEQHALSKAGAQCRSAISNVYLTLGSHHITSLGDLASTKATERIDGSRATVWLSRGGASVEFQLVKASAKDLNEFQPPDSDWRITVAPGLKTSSNAPGVGQS